MSGPPKNGNSKEYREAQARRNFDNGPEFHVLDDYRKFYTTNAEVVRIARDNARKAIWDTKGVPCWVKREGR